MTKLSLTNFQVRYAIRIIKNPRNNSRYKHLSRFSLNFLNITKLYKLRHSKWNSLQTNKNQIYESRLNINQFNTNNLINRTKLKTFLNKTKKKYFLNQIQQYRLFRFWYAIKKKKIINKYYNKNSFLFHKKNFYFITKLCNLFCQFEYRIDTILYRSFLLPSIYFSQKFISNKNILINKKKLTYFNYIIKQNDLIEIKNQRKFILKNLQQNLRKRYKLKFLSLLNYKHLEINFNTLSLYITKQFILLNQINTFFSIKLNLLNLQQYFNLKIKT